MLEDLLYNYLFSITDGPTKVSRLLHDLWLGASLHTKKWESNLNSNQESHICSLALRNDEQTDKVNYKDYMEKFWRNQMYNRNFAYLRSSH